ncbi:unnamed protein product [Candida verbasci]|uniref:Major facilitator superfamily (MFS) profile domain-containing protein n=1 Tax=Candida verbasci TaxID=1227364 RepID=A0A9W4XJC5_9ASCO|nr:unnamed protein product [Candida verbasci]
MSIENQDIPSSSNSPPILEEPQFQNIVHEVEFEGEVLVIDSTNWRNSTLLKLQILSGFSVFILFGLAEQTLGTLLPKLQDYYKINDLHISFVFLVSTSGYLTLAAINNITHDALGIRGVAILGSVAMTICYLVVSTKPPFISLLLVYFLNGIGFGSLDASLNTWMGNLHDSNQLLGILHGCYGIGSLVSPSLITYLLERKKNPWHWNDYYIILAIVGGFNIIIIAYLFRYETPKKYKYTSIMKHQKETIQLSNLKDDDQITETEIEIPHNASIKEALKSKIVWAFSLILFIYVGGEMSTGQWLVSYYLRIKDWTYKSSSHLSTTFWTGLTVGRILLGFATVHFFNNELTANLIYILTSFIGSFAFWLLTYTNVVIPIFILMFFLGCVVGPIFPTTIVASVNVLPAKYQTIGVGFICAFGGAGAAGIPFLVGLIAESSDSGLKMFPIFVMIIFGILLIMWAFITKYYSKSYKVNRL